MEALPALPMMAPQFRTSTLSYDNIPNFDFRLRMKEYILLNFNTDPHEYDSAFDELSQLKYEATIPAATVEQVCKLKRYYGQLCMMQKRFPMGSGEQLDTPFAWHDGLVDMRSANSEVTICDIEFEKASVMFNIGACHAQHAAEQPRDTQDSIKVAFMHFQYAAYAFEQLNSYRNSDMFYPSADLDANVIAFYYKVLIAQAQECLVQKSLLDNRSPIVIAKLSLWLQEAFDSAAKLVDEWTVNIPESVQRYYAKLCRLKSDIYGVISFMSMGDNSEKEGVKKMGWRLQYYNIAYKYMEHLQMNSAKMKDRYPELLVTTSFLFDVITAKQKNAEKENDFIYHDRVPKEDEAIDAVQKDGGAMCKVKTLAFDPLDPSVSGPDLFGKLLPSFVVESVQKYDQKKQEILTEIKEMVSGYDKYLNQQLELAEFEKLRFMLAEGKNEETWFEIPDELMKRNADMTAYTDCVPNLLEKLRESQDTARVAEAKLNTLIAKLRAIDLPRIKSDEGYMLISKELDRLAEHLSQAKANNLSLNKAIAQHSTNLQILTLPCVEMWRKIVPEKVEEAKTSSQMSPEEVQIRKMVDKILEMQSQRRKLIEQLAQELKADEISNKLMGINERGAEEVMAAEIGKHSNTQQLIRLNVTAQDTILRAFTDANADFFEERSSLSQRKSDYDRKVGELCASYEVYKEVRQKCEEGDQFYRQLMARCDQFAIPVHAMEEQYRAEIEKEEKAQKEAEHHMNQIRMSREAQNALMDFGGGAPAHGAPRAYGPAPGALGAPGAPPSSSTRGPRLGDYLESYRARKQNPGSMSSQISIPPQDFPSEGPPSPTPSSICDYPVSRFGQPSPRTQAPPTFAPYPGAAPQSYGAPLGAPGAQGYGGISPRAHGAHGAPTVLQGYGGPQQQQFAAPGAHGAQNYQAPSHQDYGRSNSYQGAHGAPTVPHGYGAPAHGAHNPNFAAPGAPGHYFQQANLYQNPMNQAQFQAPPTQHFAPAQAPPTSNYAPAPNQAPSHQAPPTQNYAPAQAPPTSSYAPTPNQAPPTFNEAPAQAPPTSSYAPAHAPPAPNYAPPPQSFEPAKSNYAPAPNQGNFDPAPGQAPPTSSYAPTQAPPTSSYAPPSQSFEPAKSNYAPAQAPPPQQFAQAPPTPNYAPAPMAQPTYQHPPQGPAIPAPGAPQNHQHVAPPTSQAPPNQAPPTQAPPTHFTPTPGAPSPWHATPAELKTPWNTTPQYHSSTSPLPQAPPTFQNAPGGPGAQPARSNVDLLSDLLGDFSMQPPIQPTVHNAQNLQHQAPQDFRVTSNPPDRGPPLQQQAPPTFPAKTTVIRPAAAVQPMPQQPANLREIAQNLAENSTETPILLKNGSPSITELSDPAKFEMGLGNAQKLEKRMLHQSIRSNMAPPPFNPLDPLNQIDAFSFATRQK